jgi:hypothetical protein
VGYNVGELHTWHTTEPSLIQPKIIAATKASLLMHTKFPPDTPIALYFSQSSFEPELEACMHELTGGLLSKSQFTSNFSPNIADAVQVGDKSGEAILRLGHLVKLCKLENNVHCLSYVISLLGKVGRGREGVLGERLKKLGETYCAMALKEVEKGTNKDDLKEVLFGYIKTTHLLSNTNEIIQICVMIPHYKEATSEILALISSQSSEALIQVAACNFLAAYTP